MGASVRRDGVRVTFHRCSVMIYGLSVWEESHGCVEFGMCNEPSIWAMLGWHVYGKASFFGEFSEM